MLDLNPAVQLEEPEVAAVEHELRRAGASVADRARERDRRVAHLRAERGVERGRGRLLEHLLVAALHGALALAERDDVAVLVGEELDLDVARTLDVALCEDRAVTERRLGLAARRRTRLLELARAPDDAHPAAASARGGLEDQREAELGRIARLDDGDPGLLRDLLRAELVARRLERLRRRPDPDEPGRLDRACELRVLGEKAVAGMDRVGARQPSRADVLLRVEVRGDIDRLVGAPSVERASVVRSGHRDRLDIELAAGAEHAQRDLAAVRHEELPDRHRARSLRAGLPA